jgi:hypothetical protein
LCTKRGILIVVLQKEQGGKCAQSKIRFFLIYGQKLTILSSSQSFPL